MKNTVLILGIVGTLLGLTVKVQAQGAGNAIQFDGVDDYIFVPSTPSIDGGPQATYEAWVYPTSEAADGEYVGIVGAGDSTWPTWNTQQGRMLYY